MSPIGTTTFTNVVIGSASVAVVAAGWVVNSIASRRALRRDARIGYLLSAYKTIDDLIGRKWREPEIRAMEAAISDIQLLGSLQQIKLAEQFARELQSLPADALPLLLDLRASLRRELLLEPVPGHRRLMLRIEPDEPSRDQADAERSPPD